MVGCWRPRSWLHVGPSGCLPRNAVDEGREKTSSEIKSALRGFLIGLPSNCLQSFSLRYCFSVTSGKSGSFRGKVRPTQEKRSAGSKRPDAEKNPEKAPISTKIYGVGVGADTKR